MRPHHGKSATWLPGNVATKPTDSDAEERTMKAAIYARVSKANGDQTPENQIEALTEWARRLGQELVATYVDRQTGSTDDRPALKEALRAAHERRFDVLLVAALDRVSRGGVASLAGILEKLAATNVAIKSLREEWLDTTSPLTRELLVAVFAWIAKVERAQLIERTKAGMARARRRGVQIGRPQAVDADQARRALAQAGSLRKAAKLLHVTEATIRRRLAG
jgi:DNA invertase Pin-like site-specific DNA recombinase